VKVKSCACCLKARIALVREAIVGEGQRDCFGFVSQDRRREEFYESEEGGVDYV
jgi:hypothetical protein